MRCGVCPGGGVRCIVVCCRGRSCGLARVAGVAVGREFELLGLVVVACRDCVVGGVRCCGC